MNLKLIKTRIDQLSELVESCQDEEDLGYLLAKSEMVTSAIKEELANGISWQIVGFDNKLSAIKEVRYQTGLGLKESKAIIDSVASGPVPMPGLTLERVLNLRLKGVQVEEILVGRGFWTMKAHQLRALIDTVDDDAEVMINAPLCCSKNPATRNRGGHLTLPTHGISHGTFQSGEPNRPFVCIEGTDVWGQMTTKIEGSPGRQYNMNTICHVVLTTVGAQRYNDHYSDRIIAPVREGDKVKIILWALASVFGPIIALGRDIPFVDNVVCIEQSA